MKRIQGQNLFTFKPAGSGKPEIRPEIAEKVQKILDNLEDGETVWFEEVVG